MLVYYKLKEFIVCPRKYSVPYSQEKFNKIRKNEFDGIIIPIIEKSFPHELEKKNHKAKKIERDIKKFIQKNEACYRAIGLILLHVTNNANNQSQYIAHFDCLDIRDLKYREIEVNASKLAVNHNEKNISAIINKAIKNCPRKLVEEYFPEDKS